VKPHHFDAAKSLLSFTTTFIIKNFIQSGNYPPPEPTASNNTTWGSEIAALQAEKSDFGEFFTKVLNPSAKFQIPGENLVPDGCG